MREYAWWGWWVFWLLLVTTLFWAAIWWWAPKRFGRDGYTRARFDGELRPGPYTGRGPRGYRRSDQRIVEDISDRLTISGDIDASDVVVECREGEVTLRGTVDSRMERRTAEAIADAVPGVKDIKNELQLRRVLPDGRTQPEQGAR